MGAIVIDTEQCLPDQLNCPHATEAAQTLDSAAPSPARTRFLEQDRSSAWLSIRIPCVLVSASDGERLRSHMSFMTMEIYQELHFVSQVSES